MNDINGAPQGDFLFNGTKKETEQRPASKVLLERLLLASTAYTADTADRLADKRITVVGDLSGAADPGVQLIFDPNSCAACSTDSHLGVLGF